MRVAAIVVKSQRRCGRSKMFGLMGRTSNSQQRLLTAASELLWEKSYHSVTVDEVCARAGVMKGSLYHFFDSKSALALAALQHLWETVAKPAYEKHFSAANAPLARITDFLSWLQGWSEKSFATLEGYSDGHSSLWAAN